MLNSKIVKGPFGRDQILVEKFRIWILARNVSGDESESLYETVWLVHWVLIHKKTYIFFKKYINENVLPKNSGLFVGKEQLKYNPF